MPTLHFKGKTFVQNHHLAVKYHQLVPKKELSLTDNISLHDNLIIHGDNLKALKALLPTYAGKVKCIYIDPPYNTGGEGWIYNDNVNSPMLNEWLGKVVDKEDMTRHDKWLCMMMPRLKLLRELLSEDGVIFISIDENEQHRLRCLLDEIFGEENFVGEFIWKNKHGGGGDSPHIVKEHEHIFFFCKNFSTLPELFAQPPSDYQKMFREEDERGKFYYDRLDKKGIDANRPNLIYPIECPDGTMKDISPAIWRLSKEEFERRKSLNQVGFKKDKNGEWQIYTKTYLHDENGDQRKVKARSILKQEIVGFTQNGNRENEQIFGERNFQNPKPIALIKYLIDIVTDKDKEYLILDSFAGSGTTANAVLQLNKEDKGKRKFILVEQETYANTLTAERVRRIIKGIKNADDENLKKGTGGTFSYFQLGESIEMESILTGKSLPSYEELARYIFYTATGQEFHEKKINRKTYFIGETEHYELYMLYEPNIDWLKQNALTLDGVRSMPKYTGKQRLVFAPAKYVDDYTLLEHRIDFCQLPYEIYRIQK
jgi:adenine-specific DNA-methyltransferase